MSESLYAGRVLYGEPPHRNIESKWYVSPDEYRRDKYPPFVAAGFILFTSKSLERFFNASKSHKLFKLDDVHVAIIAEHLQIQPVHMSSVLHRSEPDQDLANINETISAHSFTPTKLAKIWRNAKQFIRLEKSCYEKFLQ